MLNYKTLIATTALVMFAAPLAHAGDVKAEETAQTQSKTVYTQNQESTEVRSAIATGDMVRVVDENGNVYINKFIAIEDLPDPTLNVEVLDTMTFEYEGRIYTNRIVETE